MRMAKTSSAMISMACLIWFACAVASGGKRAKVNMSADTPRDLNTHHLFAPPTSREAWEPRAAEIRTQILFSAGLVPMPAKTPLHPLVTGKIDGPDYTVENVALETRPGFYLCGNLYRPKGRKAPFPGIVNPHGHWANGRLEMQPDVPKADPTGKMGDGRGNLVSIGVNLAKQGHVVFAYDMIGYNDTNQVDHKFAGNLRCWLWGVSLSGLQLWDSIRVVDYLQSLPDVDKKRIGCTGASGGGTQTFLLSAVDDRVKVAVPVNMISAYMQGGCLCENGPGLRVGTDNSEISACTAPRAQLLIAATGDWTKEVPKEEWPTIKKVYDLYGAGDKTAAVQFNYQHNYNGESREAMYAWFGKWFLSDSNPEHFREKTFTADVKAMHVWTDHFPMPKDALKEPALIQSMIEASDQQLAAMLPKRRSDLKRFAESYRPALAASLAVSPAESSSSRSKEPSSRKAFLIVTDPASRQDGDDLIRQLKGSATLLTLPPVEQDQQALWSSFFSCYNQTPVGDRVQAILNKLATVRAANPGAPVCLVGFGKAGLWTLFAGALSGNVDRTAADFSKFPVADAQAYLAELYAPGLLRAGGIQTAAVLLSDRPLFLMNTGRQSKVDEIQSACRAVGSKIKVDESKTGMAQIAAWLTGGSTPTN